MGMKPSDKLAALLKRLSKLLSSNPHLLPYLHPLTHLYHQRPRLTAFHPRRLFTPKLIRRTIYVASLSTLLYYARDDLSKYFEAAIRVTRTTRTALSIVMDYRRTLYTTAYPNQDTYEDAKGECHQRSANKLLHLISTNRGIYVKLGQHITSLDYVLPKEYCETMQQMYCMAPQSTRREVERVFEEEMQGKWGRRIRIEDVFEEWDWVPLGTASLAQVHKARLKMSGISFLDSNIFEASAGSVAIKIQHANVLRHSALDILTVRHLVDLVQWIYPEVQLKWLADEMATNLPKEMNFVQEGENAERAGAFLATTNNKLGGKYSVHVPAIWWPCTTPRVLVMELIEDASTVTDTLFLKKHGIDTGQVADAIGALYADMIFKYGFVHCDPHPGNLFIQRIKHDDRLGKDAANWRLVLLDHGLYKELSREFRMSYARMWMTLLRGGHDEAAIKEASDALGGGISHRLLSSILTHRSWRNLGGRDSNGTATINTNGSNAKSRGSLWRVTRRQMHDIELLRARAAAYFASITQLLARLPRELLLLLKTNDLLMAIERTLVEEGSVAPSIVQMSLACGDLLSREDIRRIQSGKEAYWRLRVAKVRMDHWWLCCKMWVLRMVPIWLLDLIF